MSVAKEKYIAFTQDHYVPIFFRPYYLDAVCDAPWDVVLYEEGQEIQAVYVFMLKVKFGVKYIVQPMLCPYTGPLFIGEVSVRGFSALIDNLPKHHLLIQDYYFKTSDIPGDVNMSFKKHTWVINSWLKSDQLWNNLSPKHRRVIRKAEAELNLEEINDIDEFLLFVETTFKKRGKQVPHSNAIFKKLDKALFSRGNRKIVKCTNKENVTVAMCYFVKDENWTYNFANSVIDDYRHHGMNLILWKEIKITLQECKSFDFEGSMIPGVNEFFKRFKGEKKQYLSQYRSNNFLIDILVKLKGLKRNG